MSSDGRVYVLKNGSTYWNGMRWHPCLRCAVRLTQDEAHGRAHKSREGIWKVIRVRKKPVQT